VAYRGAARGLGADDTKGPAERLAALRSLRRTHFGDAADKLFGAEEREAEAAIARAAVAGEKGLSAADRSDRLAEVDERLPAAERQARAAATSVIQLREDEAALRAAGADEDEIHRFRAGTLGEDAAVRLEDLDRQRAAWKQRVEAFRRERDQRCGEGAAGSACEAGLLEASFDAREQIRVRVILGAAAN
jgi:lipase chaperone LimK